MISLPIGVDKAVISRLVISSLRFEILVDPVLALKFKEGEKVELREILAYPAIYRDVSSTEVVAENELQKNFGTIDVYKIAEKILKDGEIQLTTEQRREMTTQKKNQIVSMISKRGINPQTKTPHPPQRIFNVIDQSGVNIDPFIDAEMQIEKVVKAIKSLIPISFQKALIQIKIPPQFSGKIYPILKSIGDVEREQWLNDGSLQVDIKILAGLQDELTNKIAGLTHGQYDLKVLKREEV